MTTKALVVSNTLANPRSWDILTDSNHNTRTIYTWYVTWLPTDQTPTQDFPIHRIEADHDVTNEHIARFRPRKRDLIESQLCWVSAAMPGKSAVCCCQNHD